MYVPTTFQNEKNIIKKNEFFGFSFYFYFK